jgi:hydroxyacylglutathione hydrolase
VTVIHVVPVLSDNYSYVIEHDGHCAVVDPGEAKPVLAFLDSHGLKPELILLTHHHGDHIAGTAEIQRQFDACIAAPASEKGRIPNVKLPQEDQDILRLGTLEFHVIATPGHTSGHIAFYSPEAKALFSGDTLFSLGCGRLFEGTPEQMWMSLNRLAALPGDTLIYCGHEYTAANGLFALEADPDNADLLERMAEVNRLREDGQPTLPVSLGLEKKTNPFLRAGSAERFAELRRLKDTF